MNERPRRRDRRAVVTLTLALIAFCAGVVPLPADWVERWYSRNFYPRLQSTLTPLSNLVPVSLVDIAVAFLLAGALVLVARHWRAAGWKGMAVTGAYGVISAAALLYLVFLVTWGLNYRRLPLERKLAYDSSRVTRDAAFALAQSAVSEINNGYRAAHAGGAGPSLERAFREALQMLGQAAPAAVGHPKRSLLSWYFRYAGIDGMTNPFFLDIVINPDVLPMERPDVLTHEWAHLAGYADEAEANFIAWLTCVRGDAMARYSGWLALYRHVVWGLSAEDRRNLAASLADGPRADLRAMAARHARGSRVVQRAQRSVYDVYLKANRTEEGVARYNAVARLVIGTRFGPGWTPQPRYAGAAWRARGLQIMYLLWFPR